jgi:Putative Actinobacterial Holin-X, holin superfamily III
VNENGLTGAIRRTTADVKRLARLQADLAKATARKKSIFAGLGAGGTLFLLYALLFLLGAAAAGLAIVLPVWLAILIVGAALLLLAGVLIGISSAGLKSSKKPPVESESSEEVPWVPAKSS